MLSRDNAGYVGTSVATLARLYAMFQPGRKFHRTSRGSVGLAESLMPLVLLAPRLAVTGTLLVQQLILLRASQRAEYLADVIAARLASPASMADALDTLVTGRSTHSWVLGRRRFTDPKTVIWDQFRSALAAVPESEIDDAIGLAAS
jgi:Zn-dependent protease with chaperone function